MQTLIQKKSVREYNQEFMKTKIGVGTLGMNDAIALQLWKGGLKTEYSQIIWSRGIDKFAKTLKATKEYELDSKGLRVQS